ncbi:hypothetical protein Ddc_13988 [Ditylenchus destructor]|nr:hypothetical protein Ddc_13988 [Ditylenchus destructor]
MFFNFFDHAPDPVKCGPILLVCSTSILIYIAHVIVAIWRVSRTSPPFLLFFCHECTIICYLLNTACFGLEITFGKELPIPARIWSLIMRIIVTTMTLTFVVIAASRCFAVFMPLAYNKLSMRSRLFPYICIICWSLGIIISFAETYAVGSADDDAFPTHNIQDMDMRPKRFDAKGAEIQRILQSWPLLLIVSCLLFYLVAVIKLVVYKLCGAGQATQHLITDQMRLFLICLFCYLPYLALLVFAFIVIPRMDPRWSGFVNTFLITVLSTVEPSLLFAMSKPIRTEFPAYCRRCFSKRTTVEHSGNRNASAFRSGPGLMPAMAHVDSHPAVHPSDALYVRRLYPYICIVCCTLGIILSFAEAYAAGPADDDAFPTHNIQKMDMVPKRYDADGAAIQRILHTWPLPVAVSCLLFYLAAVIKLVVCKFCGTGQATKHLTNEQMRLFLICFLCYLPYLALPVFAFILIPRMDPRWSGFTNTLLVTTTFTVEPSVLLVMSRQIRTAFPAYCRRSFRQKVFISFLSPILEHNFLNGRHNGSGRSLRFGKPQDPGQYVSIKSDHARVPHISSKLAHPAASGEFTGGSFSSEVLRVSSLLLSFESSSADALIWVKSTKA